MNIITNIKNRINDRKNEITRWKEEAEKYKNECVKYNGKLAKNRIAIFDAIHELMDEGILSEDDEKKFYQLLDAKYGYNTL